MWIINRSEESDQQQDSIHQLENRFRSGGIEESEIVWMRIYPNRCFFSIKIVNSETGDTLKHNYRNFTDMQKYHNFWRPVNSADMLEISKVFELQRSLC